MYCTAVVWMHSTCTTNENSHKTFAITPVHPSYNTRFTRAHVLCCSDESSPSHARGFQASQFQAPLSAIRPMCTTKTKKMAQKALHQVGTRLVNSHFEYLSTQSAHNYYTCFKSKPIESFLRAPKRSSHTGLYSMRAGAPLRMAGCISLTNTPGSPTFDPRTANKRGTQPGYTIWYSSSSSSSTKVTCSRAAQRSLHPS